MPQIAEVAKQASAAASGVAPSVSFAASDDRGKAGRAGGKKKFVPALDPAMDISNATVVGLPLSKMKPGKDGEKKTPNAKDVTIATEQNPVALLARGALVRRRKTAAGGSELMETRPLFEPQRSNAQGMYSGRQMNPTVLIKTSHIAGSEFDSDEGPGKAHVNRFVQDHRALILDFFKSDFKKTKRAVSLRHALGIPVKRPVNPPTHSHVAVVLHILFGLEQPC